MTVGKDLHVVLTEGAKALGVALPSGSAEAFDFFLVELMRWNRKMNLTAIRDPFEILVKHFLDSLALSQYLSPGSSLVDVGSGAGFPCIVLKISDPSLEVISIDSSRKKLSFQRHLIGHLRLKGIDTVHAHLPDPRIVERFDRTFDYAVSRAFGSLETFLRVACPLIKSSGKVIAMKGKVGVRRRTQDKAARQVNMRLQRTVSFTLPFINADRTFLFFARKEFP